MIRLRLLLLLAGTGTLLVGLPAGAAPSPSPGVVAGEAQALTLLTAAATAARTRTYSGTQYIATWAPDSSHVAEVRHTPDGGSAVSVRPTAGGDAADVTVGTDLDVRLLRLLAQHYELVVTPDERCTGRTAHVVEARSAGDVRARFWLDGDSGLVLRREVFDRRGSLVRSSAFASLDVQPGTAAVPPSEPAQVDAAQLRSAGWRVPDALPGGLDLYDARTRTHDGQDVLHLSYSDGLSTLSLFAQRGRLGSEPMHGFAKQEVGRASVWVRSSSSPRRVVWGGDGRVFTLLTDAPAEAVSDVVKALPHDRAARTGFLARIGRGLSRLASWLNPFD
ncbi:MAG: putative sigma regulatory protein MucB/RseB [Frankiales bacterium]|nr:putative sigma regulatory protein MucB/RseB [Frankiales bacterium]